MLKSATRECSLTECKSKDPKGLSEQNAKVTSIKNLDTKFN